MAKDLTTSAIDRQNVLNNPYALAEIEKAAKVRGIAFEGKTVVLKEQAASFFEVTVRTIENYVERFPEELTRNGYEIVRSKRLKELKLAIQALDVPETEFGNIAKSPQLSVCHERSAARGDVAEKKVCLVLDRASAHADGFRSKPAAPLLACVIRRVFFLPTGSRARPVRRRWPREIRESSTLV
ncbi:MAG: hypothetical protein ACREIA_21660 [Opitutaceae bacterium]